MKKLLLIIISLIFALTHSAQVKHDYNWSIGEGTDCTGDVDAGMDIDFNTNPVSIQVMWRDIDIRGTNATMSDADGNLIFYTNGCKIFNADHELMENGNNINAGEVNDIQCPDDILSGAYTVTNGILALPDPGSDSLYYLFHQRLIYLYDPFEIKIDRLLYTVININEDDGKGAVIQKDIIAVADTLWYGDLGAVRHSNGDDWWITSSRAHSDTTYLIPLTESGVLPATKYQLEGVIEDMGDLHESCFSPDGTKYMRFDMNDHILLYDFDRSTGIKNNLKRIFIGDSVFTGGISVSPNSRFMYVSTLLELYQYDLLAADVEGSKILVGVYDGFEDPFPTVFRRMQLGPDCRIYMESGGSHYSWHVINKPDEPGVACDFRQRSFELPYSNFRAMPKFPNYRLGTTPTYPCDSTIAIVLSTNSAPLPTKNVSVLLYPNPVKVGGTITIELQNSFEGEFLLYDLLGQVVATRSVAGWERRFDLNLPGKIAAGGQYWVLRSAAGEVASGKLTVFN